MVMLVMLTAKSPELVNVTVCVALVTFSGEAAKLSEVGEAAISMVSPVPLKLTDGPGVP